MLFAIILSMFTLSDIAEKSNQELQQLLLNTSKELSQKAQEITLLRQRLNQLLQNQYGRKSEKLDYSLQDHLFDEADLSECHQEDVVAAEEQITVPAHTRQRGRKPLPKELPRIRVDHDLREAEKHCHCGCQLTQIGEDISEQLDIIPAQVRVIQHVRLKYACKGCEETIKRAKAPNLPIPKSIASPGLLSHIIVSKFKDHLPLYRQEHMFQRMGVDIPRHTLSYWIIRCGELLKPLVRELRKIICQYDVAFADETTVQVLKEKNRPASTKSYMWLFAGGPPEKKCFIYEYNPSRSHEIAKDFFAEFSGYLHCDGYPGYQTLFNVMPINGVHCWMHARRKFMDIIKTIKGNKTGLCHWAVAQIAKLYQIEAEAKANKLTPQQRKQLRLTKAKPILDTIKAWLDKKIATTPPSFAIGKAIAYCVKFWPALIRYLEDGRLEIDNGLSERAIRPFTIGRKNWVFCDTPNGAHAAAVIYSLVETCKTHDIEPYAYFRYVLSNIARCETPQDYQTLLPFHLRPEQLIVQ